MKTPLETRGSRANDGRSARLGKKQPDGTHAHRIAHVPRIRPLPPHVHADAARPGRGRGGWCGARGGAARLAGGVKGLITCGNAWRRGYRRVSSFPLTGEAGAPIPTEEFIRGDGGQWTVGGITASPSRSSGWPAASPARGIPPNSMTSP